MSATNRIGLCLLAIFLSCAAMVVVAADTPLSHVPLAAATLAIVSATIFAAAVVRLTTDLSRHPVVQATPIPAAARPDFGRWFGALLLFAAAAGCFTYSKGPRLDMVRVISESCVAVLTVAGVGVLVGSERLATVSAVIAGVICFFARGGLSELLWYGSFWGIGFILLCLPIVLSTFLYLFIWRNP